MAAPDHHIVNYRTFVTIWALLVALTGATVAASRIDLGPWNIWAALAIATVKSTLVALYFMHLKYENRAVVLSFLLTLVILAIFIGFTFFDVLYR